MQLLWSSLVCCPRPQLGHEPSLPKLGVSKGPMAMVSRSISVPGAAAPLIKYKRLPQLNIRLLEVDRFLVLHLDELLPGCSHLLARGAPPPISVPAPNCAAITATSAFANIASAALRTWDPCCKRLLVNTGRAANAGVGKVKSLEPLVHRLLALSKLSSMIFNHALLM